MGTGNGKQILNLGDGCVYLGVTVHEMMHAVGFWHEQSRPDRDDFVEIKLDNVQPMKDKYGQEISMKHNFDKKETYEVKLNGIGYDYGSLMHYGRKDFGCAHDDKYRQNCLVTIEPKDRNAVIGQRDNLSPLDIQKLNALYNPVCKGTEEKPTEENKPKTAGECTNSCTGHHYSYGCWDGTTCSCLDNECPQGGGEETGGEETGGEETGGEETGGE